jgi:subfamily B ATP-binding cassette protein MsbA
VKLTGPLIDELFVHRNASLAILLPLAIVAVFVVSGLASFVSGYANQWVSNKVILDLRREMFARVLRLPAPTSTSRHRAARHALHQRREQHRRGLDHGLTVLVRDSVTIAGAARDPALLELAAHPHRFLVIPPIALVVRIFSKRLRQMSRESQARWAASPRCSTSRSPTSAWCASSAARRTRARASSRRARSCAAST